MNKHSYFVRLLSVLICVFMCVGGMPMIAFAAQAQDLSGEIVLDDNLLAADKYSVYDERYGNIPEATVGAEPIILDGTDVLLLGEGGAIIATPEEYTTDPTKLGTIGKVMPITLTGVDEQGVSYPEGTVVEGVEQTQTGLYLPSDGHVSVKVNIPETGRYAMQIEYFPVIGFKTGSVTGETVENTGSTIERTLYIDGVVPFYEARFLSFSRIYSDILTDDYDGDRMNAFEKDIAENEMRPDKIQTPRWMKAYFTDSTGNHLDPFRFYFTEGEHTITIDAQREGFVISKISVVPFEDTISYDEYLKKHEGNVNNGDIEGGSIKLEGELYTSTSDRSVYPTADHSSAITSPQNASREVLNMVSEDNWKTLGQWASWVVDAPKAGYYKIAVRYRQSTNDGLFSSRILRVNGEIPFDEAKRLQFDYNDLWQTCYLNDGSEEHADGFLIYLNEGKNTITLEANLGNMTEVIRELSEVITTINASYIDILKITGNTPDANRDYGFYGLIPGSIDDLADMSDKLYEIADELAAISGKSANLTTLENVARRLNKMGNKEDEVAKNMSGLKSDIGSLGTWLQTAMTQPLSVDYISIQGADSGEEDLPRANENFFESLWYEIRMFGMSFVSDYNTLGVMEEVSEDESIIVWTSAGRDQLKIIRNLVNDFSADSGIAVSLKLTAAGSLLPSILAGVGPDVSLDNVTIVDWAIRGAIVPLGNVGTGEEYFEGFNDLYNSGQFPEAAFIPLTLYTDDIKDYNYEEHGPITDYDATVYGLPNTLDFFMMFYREDVFRNLGIEAPQTWDDFYSILPVLQDNQMQVVFPTAQGGINLFLYQMLERDFDPIATNGMYADNGRRINLDSDIALTAFDRLCSIFTQYKLPVAPNFENQFRTGDIPLGIVTYSVYTQLSVFAPEIRGLWKFVPVPGYEYVDENGDTQINKNTVSYVSSIVMPRGDRSDEKAQNAFDFMAWYVGAENQANYANEYGAWMGQNTKYNTANIEALYDMNWTTEEAENIKTQMENLVGIPDYPGSYIITRNINNAFMNSYNNNTDPVTTMLDYIVDINKELTRKRDEFGLDTHEISYTNNFTEEKN